MWQQAVVYLRGKQSREETGECGVVWGPVSNPRWQSPLQQSAIQVVIQAHVDLLMTKVVGVRCGHRRGMDLPMPSRWRDEQAQTCLNLSP